jgi:hypothetical protein
VAGEEVWRGRWFGWELAHRETARRGEESEQSE